MPGAHPCPELSGPGTGGTHGGTPCCRPATAETGGNRTFWRGLATQRRRVNASDSRFSLGASAADHRLRWKVCPDSVAWRALTERPRRLGWPRTPDFQSGRAGSYQAQSILGHQHQAQESRVFSRSALALVSATDDDWLRHAMTRNSHLYSHLQGPPGCARGTWIVPRCERIQT
jgi:hypothetical protein